MKIVTKFIDNENIKELREVFQSLDLHHTGFITVNDLKKAILDLGFNDEAKEIQKIVNEVDYLS